LLRFENQARTKSDLINNYSDSLSKILSRESRLSKVPPLPQDLRSADDYSLHGNRSVFLYTWLKSKNSPINVFEDKNTFAKILENQARTEQVEYYNSKIARACQWAEKPINDKYLLNAYKVLAASESMVHRSSKSGEVVDALSHMINSLGTMKLVPAGKETARFHIDELKYQSNKAKNNTDRWLALVFGLVGATSLSQFAIHPFVKQIFPKLSNTTTPMVSLCISTGAVLLIARLIWCINGDRASGSDD
jgi:hypothetical protein